MRNCPDCGGKLKVLGTRERVNDKVKAQHPPTYRRKECQKCKKRFSTVEVWTEDASALISGNDSVQRDKVVKAIGDFISALTS